MNNHKLVTIVVLLAILFSGCKKFVSVSPPDTRLIAEAVYSTNSTAASSINGIYSTLIRNSFGAATRGITAYVGLSADEFHLFPTSESLLNQFYLNELQPITNIPMWGDLYNIIYQSNLAIEGLEASTGLSANVRQQLLGEAKFIRALGHFYLTNLYGDIPILIRSDFKSNQTLSRSAQNAVYNQIILDLVDAKGSLPENYATALGTEASDRVRPNKFTASALLARVYLYSSKYDSAILESTYVLSDSKYQLANNLHDVFSANDNREAIWQLEMPNNGSNAPEGDFLAGYYSTTGPSATYPLHLNDSLVSDFEDNDLRKTDWIISNSYEGITYYFPYKYRMFEFTGQPPVEYPVVFRLAEQYLIRAEARAQLDNIEDGAQDVNMIRERAGLSAIVPSTKSELLTSIMEERRHELFLEYGHRWFDLKRTNSIDEVMSLAGPLKGGTWQSYDQFYPLNISELQLNPRLEQNLGY